MLCSTQVQNSTTSHHYRPWLEDYYFVPPVCVSVPQQKSVATPSRKSFVSCNSQDLALPCKAYYQNACRWKNSPVSCHKAYWSRGAPTSFSFNNSMLCPHCIYLTTNSDLCHLQHKLIGFYNRDEKCLRRGTDWAFTYNPTLCPHCICVFCIYLRTNCNLCHLQHKLIGFYNRDEVFTERYGLGLHM